MIYGKIWTVVNPSVGIPLFLSAVAVTSFAVHLALVNNTTWIKAYHNGAAGKTAVVAMAAPAAPPAAEAPAKK
jgi:light-harvesting protein B-800-850 alpha chain